MICLKEEIKGINKDVCRRRGGGCLKSLYVVEHSLCLMGQTLYVG